MALSNPFVQSKTLPQFSEQCIRGVADAGQPAALLRSVRGKCGDDGGAARPQSRSEVSNVADPVVRIDQEVKNGTVVPDVNERDMPVAGHVRLDPRHASGILAQARSGLIQGGGGNVEHADAPHAFAEDEVHEAGIPAPDVDDSGARSEASRLEEARGHGGHGLKPTYRIRCLRLVDAVPVGLSIHRSRFPSPVRTGSTNQVHRRMMVSGTSTTRNRHRQVTFRRAMMRIPKRIEKTAKP